MSPPTLNAKSPTVRRILKEATELSTNPDPTIHAAPLESNIFDWHFTIQGPPSTPYDKGIYHGRIILPPQYPLRPPMFRFLTPSGRFEVNREICLSISGHHEETWQPAWGIRTALAALRAFMEGGAKGQVGGMDMPDGERRRLAEESQTWRCMGCGSSTNQEILKLQKEEVIKAGDSTKKAESIPDELRFGFKDEMTHSKDITASAASTSEGSNSSHIVSAPIPSATEALTLHAEISDRRSGEARNRNQDGFTEQGRRPLVAVTQSQSPVTSVRMTAQQDTVPAWIDKLIVALTATLVIMVVKKLFT